MKAESIAAEIDERFFKKGEAKEARDSIVKTLNDFYEHKSLDTTAEDVIEFLKDIWGRFSIGKYVDVFVDFAKAEKALYGFGDRYRDHLMHVFNVHVMGLLTFSKILKRNKKGFFEALKIKEESDGVPFPSRYDKFKRLYYLWSLISTFHDIAIPIDRREDLVTGFGKYLDYFKIETEEFYLKFPFMTQSDIARYSELMSQLFAGRISLSKNQRERTYKLENCRTASYLYLRSTLTSAMNSYDHGVLGAYFLFKSIEELFLSGKNQNPKYDLDLCSISRNGPPVELPREKKERNKKLEEFLTSNDEDLEHTQRTYDLSRGETIAYNDYVFEQDVTRAALAIALHNIDPDRNPKIFPLKFSDFPLTSLLILFDELQEFHRPEGLLLTEVVRNREFPYLDVRTKFSRGKPKIRIRAIFDLEKPKQKLADKLVNGYNEWLEKHENKVKRNTQISSYDELLFSSWNHIFETIKRKIAFTPEDPLGIHVTVRTEGSEPLEYKSPSY